MIVYTLAFVFDEADRVALIRKNRPVNLAGKWNGIGGKVEPTDANHYVAAARELKEEADITIDASKLKLVAIYASDDYEIRVTAAVIPDLTVSTMTDEEVMLVRYNQLFADGVGLLLDKHALLFLQAAYIAVRSPTNFLAVITDKLSAT